VPLPELGQGIGPAEPELLVHRADHDHGRHALETLLVEPGQGGQHGGHAALDIAGAAPVKPPFAHLGRPRRDSHAGRRDRVLMGPEEDHRRRLARSARAVDPRHDIVAARLDGLAHHRDLQASEQSLKVFGELGLGQLASRRGAAHRVDAGDRHQFAQSFHNVQHGILSTTPRVALARLRPCQGVHLTTGWIGPSSWRVCTGGEFCSSGLGRPAVRTIPPRTPGTSGGLRLPGTGKLPISHEGGLRRGGGETIISHT